MWPTLWVSPSSSSSIISRQFSTRSGNVKKRKRQKYHPFWLSSEQYIYMKERSDTRMMETTNVKTSEPHQPALVLNCYVIWLRSKWGSKLTYFSNFAIYYLLVQLRVKSRLKWRAVKWVYFHSQPFSNRLNWRDDTFYSWAWVALFLEYQYHPPPSKSQGSKIRFF